MANSSATSVPPDINWSNRGKTETLTDGARDGTDYVITICPVYRKDLRFMLPTDQRAGKYRPGGWGSGVAHAFCCAAMAALLISR
jgi:hypothetical protein